jgi:hypothetical protein
MGDPVNPLLCDGIVSTLHIYSVGHTGSKVKSSLKPRGLWLRHPVGTRATLGGNAGLACLRQVHEIGRRG